MQNTFPVVLQQALTQHSGGGHHNGGHSNRHQRKSGDYDGDGVAIRVSAIDVETGDVLGVVTDFSMLDASAFGDRGFALKVDVVGSNGDAVERPAFTFQRVNKNEIVTEEESYKFSKQTVDYKYFLDEGALDEGTYRIKFTGNADGRQIGVEEVTFAVVADASTHMQGQSNVLDDLTVMRETAQADHGDMADGGHTGGGMQLGAGHGSGHGAGGHNMMVVEDNNAFLMAMGEGSRIEIHAADTEKDSWTTLSRTADAGSNRITVNERTGWEVGDKIAITSSDYSNDQHEEFTITGVSANGRTFTLDGNLEFMHWGETQTINNGLRGGDRQEWTIDERAQVALLSRNVTLTGDADADQDGYGGHTMVMHGAEMHISGAEFTKMGQEGVLGRYALHWHMLGDDAAGQYVTNSSIHDTYNKGITIHGSNHTLVQDNVVYETRGHGYFLEDGSEVGNLFQGNIGFGTRSADEDEAILKSDVLNVATFWITNPHNDFVGNVAGGSDNGGFWYAIGRDFTGDSKGNPMFAGELKPEDQKAGLFSGNTTHSNAQAGLFKTPNGDESRKSFGDNDLEVHDFNAFKNVEWSANLSTAVGGVAFFDSVFGASKQGLNFNDDTAIQYSMSYGLSDNIGNPDSAAEIDAGHSFADDDSKPSDYLEGLAFYSGEFFFNNTHFALFDGEEHYALSSKHGAGRTNYVRDLTFDRNFDASEDIIVPDGGRSGRAIFDEDGSLSGIPGAWLTEAKNAANASANSYVHADFNMFVVTDAKIAELFEAGETGNVGPSRLTRYDAVDGPRIDGVPGTGGRTQLAMIGDGNDYVYVYDFGGRALQDNQNRIHLNGATEDEYVFIESPNATSRHGVEGAIRVGSFDQLKASTEKAYYYEDGSIYTKLFGGGSSRDDASQSVINYVLHNRPEQITTVPAVRYEPIKYSEAELASFLPDVEAPRATSDASRETHDPAAHDPDASRTVDFSDFDARWSEADIWSGGDEPGRGDTVVISEGQRVVLDEDVHVKAILVDGGELIVEDNQDIALSADWILVVNGGLFQVGTEDDPFEHDFTLTLEGDNRENDVNVMALRNSNASNVVRAVDAAPLDEPPADSTPLVNPDPVDPIPIDPDPVDPTPVDPNPVDPTPVDPDPVDPPAQVNTTFKIALFETAGDVSRIDADMRDGETYELTQSEWQNANIRAALSGAHGVESVKFTSRQLGIEYVDNGGQFALFNTSNGHLNGGEIPPGRYTVLIEGFSEDRAGGELVARRSVTFNVVEEQLPDDIAIAIFDAAGGDELIGDLKNGRKVEVPADHFDQLNITADLSAIEGVESVRFVSRKLGIEHVENYAPYALFGDNGGNLRQGTIEPGRYTVWVEGYSENGGEGEILARRSVTFEIKEASGNLVEGGSFEHDVADKTWQKSVDLDGWETNSDDRGEVWGDGFQGVAAADGDNFLELDRDAATVDRIWQDVDTARGQVYELSFQAAQRGDGKDSIVVMWGGEQVTVVRPDGPEWQTFTVQVAGTGEPGKLEFRELGRQNDGRGPLIDDVALVESEASHALLGRANDWHEAVEMAEAFGGHLVRVDDQGEMDMLMETFWTGQSMFLNATDQGREGHWTDSDSNALDYTNWLAGQPNNYRNQDFGFVVNANGEWADQDANRPMILNDDGDWRTTAGIVIAEFEDVSF